MKPRRLQSATILSMVTASSAIGRRQSRLAPGHADLRIPLRQRAHVRGHAAHDGRPGRGLHGLRGARAAGVPPGGGPLQGVGLLQHRLRDQEARAGAKGLGRVGRRQARRQGQGVQEGQAQGVGRRQGRGEEEARVTARQAGLLGLLAMMWGASYLLIKYALEDFSPGMVVFARTLMGALVLYAIIRAQGAPAVGRLGELRRRPGTALLLGLVAIAVPFLLITFGELEVPSGLTAVLIASAPLWVAVIAPFADPSEKVVGRQAAGLV